MGYVYRFAVCLLNFLGGILVFNNNKSPNRTHTKGFTPMKVNVLARFSQDAYYDKYCSMLGLQVVRKKRTTPVLGTGVKLLKGNVYIIGTDKKEGCETSLYIPKNTELLITNIDKKIFDYYKKIGSDDNNYVIQYRCVNSSAILEENKPDRKVITMQMIREYPVGVGVSADQDIILGLYKFFLQYAPIINLECGATFLAQPNCYKGEKMIVRIKERGFLMGVDFDDKCVVFTGFTHTSRLDRKLALIAFVDAIVEYVKKPDAEYPRLTSLKDIISLLGCEDWILQTLDPAP